MTGSWFLDEGSAWDPPIELVDFLAAGSAPICIGFGSMTDGDPAETTRLVVEAVRRSEQRAVLLAGWADVGRIELPSSVLRLSSAPHDWLFPRMAAVIHHGGAGTTAAGLAAGLPTVVVPHMADQPYWGQHRRAVRSAREGLAAHGSFDNGREPVGMDQTGHSAL